MKTQKACTGAVTLGPFLRLVLTLAGRPEQTQKSSTANFSRTPLSATAAGEVIQRLASPELTARRPTVLGPFLTMILTLKKRKPSGLVVRTTSTGAAQLRPRHNS